MNTIRTFIGIDNGVSGSIGVIKTNGFSAYIPTPIKKELNYTKTKQWINRIDGNALKTYLKKFIKESVCVCLERPLVHPGRFKATISAIRALEATLIIIENIGYSYIYIDSKQWQKILLPSGLESNELKKASLQVAKRLFPNIDYTKFNDGDGLLIAEFCRRMFI